MRKSSLYPCGEDISAPKKPVRRGGSKTEVNPPQNPINTGIPQSSNTTGNNSKAHSYYNHTTPSHNTDDKRKIS